MKVALISRSTLYKVPGGDTVQVNETAKCLRKLGVEAEICLTSSRINYSGYGLFHFFNITRPADILHHIDKIKKPFVVSPVYVDYSEYDKKHRKGFPGFLFKLFSKDTNEYLKTISRAIKGNDPLQSRKYILKGQSRSIREIIERAALLLPNAESEYRQILGRYGIKKNYFVVPNGIDTSVFASAGSNIKNNNLVLCAARIEGIKNQLNLIRALNNTPFTLMIAGSAAPNQAAYYRECKKIAASNIQFADRLPQHELADLYAKAKVHVLPSWFETCGLSTLEAAAMGCNIVITDKGYTREYFGDDAFYCEPGNPGSIREAIERASAAPLNEKLQQKVLNNYTWEKAAAITLEAYKKVLTV